MTLGATGVEMLDKAPSLSPPNDHPQRSKSLLPPSIVELSSDSVVLSWRTALGHCSIHAENSDNISESQEWANLDEDTRKHHHAADRSVKKSGGVKVFDVDHIELQTCCGCPRCLHEGDENEQENEEGGSVESRACSCLCCPSARCGRGCWRPVYQGPHNQCRVQLVQGNKMHFFRLLVRARLPPPSIRNYMRPKNRAVSGSDPETSGGFMQPDGGGSPDLSSPNRRRQRRGNEYSGIPTVSCGDPEEETLLNGSLALANGGSRCTADVGDAHASDGSPDRGQERARTGVSLATPLRDEPRATTAAGKILWFVSDSIFVDSRPPAVALHGIGTALVLTWPALAGLSGGEQVSYILEQWSQANTTPTPSTNRTSPRAEQGAPSELNGRPKSRRGQNRHHNHRRHLPPPTQVDVKEAFAVGTRCWFMPTGLKAGMRYWYRLSLIHEGGKGVGGRWVSYSTSVAPPRCIGMTSRALVLSLPLALDDTARSVLEGESQDRRISPDRQYHVDHNSTDEYLPTPREESRLSVDNNTEHLETPEMDGKRLGARNLPTGSTGDKSEEYGDAEDAGGKKYQHPNGGEEKIEQPMVWYTLEGFLVEERRWVALYRGPSPEVTVEGLEPSALARFRLGIDVDITELRHRSLGPLASLELEPTSPDAVGVAPTTVAPAAPTTCGENLCPKRTQLSQMGPAPTRPVVVRPALRLKSAAEATNSTRPMGQGASSTKSDLGRNRRQWSPATSPAVSKMRREGFAFHDATATVGGGFYLERPLLSWGRLQCHSGGAMWECCANGGGTGEGGQCREYSATVEFATAPLAPRYAAFVVGESPQVKMWWAEPKADLESSAAPSALVRPSSAPPFATPARHRGGHRLAPAEALDSSPGRQSTGVAVGESTGVSPYAQPHPLSTVTFLEPAADGEDAPRRRQVYSGPRQWLGLGRYPELCSASGAGVFTELAPSTAYAVGLCTKVTDSQPESEVQAVVVTAPPAPVMEPIAVVNNSGAAEAEGKVFGAVTLKAAWRTDIDQTYLPEGTELPPLSTALEMAHISEAGFSARCARETAGKVAQNGPHVSSPRTAALATAAATVEGRAATPTSPNTVRSSSGTQDMPVRTDAGFGQSWTLGSSSWGGSRSRVEEFEIVWRDEEGGAGTEKEAVEAQSPPLPPGMRFLFRVRVECRFGVAVSASTVYETAPVVPLSPKGLRACLTTHESRAGNISRCVRLLWDAFHSGHGKNVVTSFTVQARRPQPSSPEGQVTRDANHPHPPPTTAHPWQDVCSCPEIGCLDPATLGAPHVLADYRVRAEGPGGKGPWCEPVRVDLVVQEDTTQNGLCVSSGGGGGGGGCESSGAVSSVTFAAAKQEKRHSGRQPMDFVRPGARARDPLTGEARRRLWVNQRPLKVPPPPAAVATLVLPGAVVTARARTTAVAEHRCRLTSGSSQLLWGALASPRAARGCRVEGTPSSRAAPGAADVCGFNHAISGGDDPENNRGPKTEGESVGPRTRARGGRGERLAVSAMPHDLALLLREELDVSCRLGCDQAGPWESEGRGGAVDRLYQRNPETPVVAWVAPPPLLGPQNQASQIQQHQHPRRSQQQQQRTRRRYARRRQDTTTGGSSRGMAKATGALPGDVSLASVPRGQQQQEGEDSENFGHGPHCSPRQRTLGTNSGKRVGKRVRAGRRRGQPSGGDIDCYKEPNAGKAAVIQGSDSNGARREREGKAEDR
ncbi:unnamed protein product [Ectocarpus fasciculatus]